MRHAAAVAALLASSLAATGCLGGAALREPLRESVRLNDPKEGSAYFEAAKEVLASEGLPIDRVEPPTWLQTKSASMRRDPGVGSCGGAEATVTFGIHDQEAILHFETCQHRHPCEKYGRFAWDVKCWLFGAFASSNCEPDVEHLEAAACVDAAVARVKRAWIRGAQRRLSAPGAAPAAHPQPPVVPAAAVP